ncbi:MAG TPA: PilZ domain-containing protein [Gemmatales bacterium]|nr:PilZ domain-containing protein [Gemmatales bacterium]
MPEQLQTDPSTNGHHTERRNEARQVSTGTAMVEPASGDGQRFSAQILEVSDNGMRIKVRNSFEEGSMVRIDLPCEQLGPVTTVLACVMHLRDEGDGLFSLGCQFCTELDDEDLDSLGVKREQIEKPEFDNRSFVRYPTRAQVLYRNLRSSTEPVLPGTVLNASPTGIGLKVKESLMPGTLLDLTVQGERGQKLFEILACVVYRHLNRDSQYTVGCNFIRELSEVELNTLN